MAAKTNRGISKAKTKTKRVPKGAAFFEGVAQIIEKARKFVGRTADLTMCVTYFEVGRMIVEEEQGGKARAEYGKGLLAELSKYLTARFGNGFSVSTLTNARKFYQIYAPSISQTMFTKLGNGHESQISQTMFTKSHSGSKSQKQQKIPAEISNSPKNQIGQTLSAQFSDDPSDQISQAMLTESEKSQTLFSFFENGKSLTNCQIMINEYYPFTLGWSHYLILMRIKNPEERRFYEIEAAKQQWTVQHLKRQYGSSLYERLALSRNKNDVIKLAKVGQTIENPRDLLKNPLVLEFLGMAEDSSYSETDLESAIIGKLSSFLLELGMGFLFEARQKRFTFDERHFFVDLVFYNRLLQCYVLIDLKSNDLTHQDLGQMQMYVNYFDRYVKKDFEKPTVGILLCKEKSDHIVEMTLPENANIYASEYSLYLPDKGLLQRKLAEWVEEFEAARGDCGE